MKSLNDLKNQARKATWESRKRRRCHDNQAPVYEGAWVGFWFPVVILTIIALGVALLAGAIK